MRQKGPLNQFEEFDAWSFSRLGGLIRSSEVKFDFPRLSDDKNILSSKVEHWEISGRLNAKSESVIRFQGRFSAEFSCVVCGSGVEDVIDFDRHLILVKSESQADSYDEDSLDEQTDVVACPGVINLRDWLEDEMLLACPMFPRHEACAATPGRSWTDEEQEPNTEDCQDDTAGNSKQEVQRPFANLGDLLKKSGKK